MTAITDTANSVYRDMESPGSTVPNDPEKVGIRQLFAVIDVALGSLGVNGAITVKKATKALLDADLAHVADVLAVVYNDATAANNGIYAKVGGSGSGSWSLTALALPASFSTDLATVLANQIELEGEIASLNNAAAVFATVAADLGVSDGVVTWDGGTQEFDVTPAAAFEGPPGTLNSNSGFTASGPVVIKGDSAALLDIQKSSTASVGKISSLEAYSGTGTATGGAPRAYFGGLTPLGDDSAICIGRNLIGASLFSHAFRDESDFLSTGDSAYTSWDAYARYKSNGSLKYNHGYGFQWRSRMAATNGMDLFTGFTSYPIVSAGTVDRLFHFHAEGQNFTGGTVSQHVGFYCSPLTGGAGTNFAFFAQANPSYLGGNLQIGGTLSGVTSITASGEALVGSTNSSGPIAAFHPTGGLSVAGEGGASGYPTLRAYSNSGGAAEGLSVITNNLLIGAASPVTGAQMEVAGSITPTTDNANNLGSASYRWGTVYAGTGTINTSDRDAKAEIGGIPDEWLDAWAEVEWARFKFKDAVEEKGDNARWHVGGVAQNVRDAFAARGLDALSIGLLCFDEWGDAFVDVKEEVTKTRLVKKSAPVPIEEDSALQKKAGTRVEMREVEVEEEYQTMEPTGERRQVTQAGSRWGLRYDECFAMEAAYQRRRMDRLEAALISRS